MDGASTRPDLARFRAFLFDLDGVLTPTVEVHRRAWAETFDAVFAARGLPPYREDEYFASLDGRPRSEGVAALLRARGLELPGGAPDDAAPDGDAPDRGASDGASPLPATGAGELDTVTGIGARKNRRFTEVLERDGIAPYAGSLRLLDALREMGAPLAVVSSSRNAEPVLRAAGLRERFQTVVDGVVAGREGLPGKPHPATFLAAAERLGVPPAQAVVFEDAASGVQAAAAGGFGLVVGVDRGAGATALREAGATVVVGDLAELLGPDGLLAPGGPGEPGETGGRDR